MDRDKTIWDLADEATAEVATWSARKIRAADMALVTRKDPVRTAGRFGRGESA